MSADKKIKKQIIEKAADNPQIFFPIKTLEKFGFKRQLCKNCGVNFWSTVESSVCGEPECTGGYTFIGESPAKNPMDFPQVYLEFSKMLQKEGYTPVKRFPVVARWRDDLDFNIASIIGFQPYVVNGEVEPPANPLTIPQICLRFADIDNIGYTGRHHTGFTMIGQHAFEQPQNYDPESYLDVLLRWYIEGLGIDKDELRVHEDAWSGGGNCGASLEVFSRGLELGNQVYMIYNMEGAEDIADLEELKLKVLDMGMGQERCCWFSKGSLNSFEACMPKVCKYLFEKTNLQPDWELYEKFLPYSGNLNIDEVEDIDQAWDELANTIKIDSNKLKSQIEPLAGIYSIADHTRTLLYAITDGALPSNVKGGYNLRLILRRALDFIDDFNWNVDLYEVMKIHAKELEPLYPELKEELEAETGDGVPTIKKLIDLEVQKHYNHKEKINHTVEKLAKKGKKLTQQDFIKLYISEGITPGDLKKGYEEKGEDLEIPSNFYTLVTQYFEENAGVNQKTALFNKFYEYVEELPATEKIFYEDTYKEKGEAKIIKEFSLDNKTYIVLDKTLFYPTGGGQAHDIGYIGEKKVVNVFSVNGVVLHEVE